MQHARENPQLALRLLQDMSAHIREMGGRLVNHRRILPRAPLAAWVEVEIQSSGCAVECDTQAIRVSLLPWKPELLLDAALAAFGEKIWT
ncbi:MAG TPA: hypothetical protein VLA89_01105 [Gemmatimonadales bacterium]|nr:hypothetical protein [Gemmatimonadales bacterium]